MTKKKSAIQLLVMELPRLQVIGVTVVDPPLIRAQSAFAAAGPQKCNGEDR